MATVTDPEPLADVAGTDVPLPITSVMYFEMVEKGMRRFSMDTYSAGKAGPNGVVSQTQALIGFIDGQPSYDETKARMLKVANGSVPPVASRNGIVAPVPQTK